MYLLNEGESDFLELYLNGLCEGGLMNIQGKNNLNSGYFSLEEQPEVVVNLIKFIENSPKIKHIFFLILLI